MWRPSQPIKHPIPHLTWPTKEEAFQAKWFSPITLGSLTLKERTWVPAMVPWRATGNGFVSDEVLTWYQRFAEGQPGAIVVEATGIRDIPSGPLLRIGHDRFLPGLEKLVKTVDKASGGKTRLLIQLIDFLTIKRRPSKEKYFRQHLILTEQHRQAFKASASDDDIRLLLLNMSEEALETILSKQELESYRFGYKERVIDLGLDHIKELPNTLPYYFSEAALRAKKAGFDGVELHYAHAYTMASFLSAQNIRSDQYGGSQESRVRLPLEVYQASRSKVGKEFTLGCRFLTDEIIKGGSRIEDTSYFAVKFAQAGMDFLSLSRGGKFEDAKQPSVGWSVYPYTGQSGYECMPTVNSDEKGPFGRNVDDVAKIRKAVRDAGYQTPIIVSGGIHSFYQAEEILQTDKADIVGAARQSLADPDWFKKTRLGRGKEIRNCSFTNYCEGLDQKHKQVTCRLWDRIDLNDPVLLTKDGRRRLVAPHWK